MNMFFGATADTFTKAKMLRAKMTKEEKLLWDKLKNRNLFPVKFRRQHPIFCYIVDFYCHSKRLVIEIDGINHIYTKEYDNDRTVFMKSLGITTIRFTNEEVSNDMNNVLNLIRCEI